ncbi:MarR family winged helix-turn-helix transcriptional regulator [Cesiribacter sp. SM1]|uniref:MarR family winged helix-turn-helix transcriptional regulator n=1 Tax=Cesiribacter sp. SM1 TaxID=2861196 RepID=UPI001CD457B8|nr:MarR family winged helix-turn-helix transcriptional regulator [Cesiribacter sp. SM1]
MLKESDNTSTMGGYVNTGAYMRQLMDEYRSNLEEAMKSKGYQEISNSHGWIFHHTKEEGSRLTELAAVAKITKQSMGALIAQLEVAGYLEKKPDPTDKRASLLFLTAEGKKIRDLGRSINYEFEKTWEQKLGPQDYEKFRSYLKKLCESD